jgi:hypothetical protein
MVEVEPECLSPIAVCKGIKLHPGFLLCGGAQRRHTTKILGVLDALAKRYSLKVLYQKPDFFDVNLRNLPSLEPNGSWRCGFSMRCQL